MPRSRYRKKVRRPPPPNSVSPGLLWENLVTTACWFIEASTVLVGANRRDRQASNFSAAEIAVFTASWCHAKITPSALHRGDSAWRHVRDVEAVGGEPEFGVSGFSQRAHDPAAPIAQPPQVAPS